MKKKKRKWTWLRYRKNDLAHNVQVAVQRWIHANGGSAVLMSGVQVITMPYSRDLNYTVGISCTGRRPEKKPSADIKSEDRK